MDAVRTGVERPGCDTLFRAKYLSFLNESEE